MGLTNSQYDAIMREYSEKQAANRQLLLSRREEITERIPEIDRIDREIAELSMEFALSALEGDEKHPPISELNGSISRLSLRKKELLSAAGYPAGYLEPVYCCPDCKDTGYIDNEKCRCFNKAVTQLLYARSNAKNIRREENFHTFSLDKYSRDFKDAKTGKSSYDQMKDILKVSRGFVENFDAGDAVKNLLFYGDTGLGKTFLANCIANELTKSCHSVICLSAIELFDICSRNEFDKDPDTDEPVREITDCDLLIIDDLGTELTNSFVTSRLFYYINDRILKDKSTVISTNLTPDKLMERYSDRILSRIIHSYKMLKFFGNNIRLDAFL
ncbi:MAG: ATP-binding protein [Alistipes sp.]|nr:ATP-binding protein [Alistipes sp.]